MAYHALEVLHGIVQSGDTKQHVTIKSTFMKTPPLPRGYLDSKYLYSQEESGLAH
ncbi:hypothetical protein D3C75_1242910 [compost metagenome]